MVGGGGYFFFNLQGKFKITENLPRTPPPFPQQTHLSGSALGIGQLLNKNVFTSSVTFIIASNIYFEVVKSFV